MTQIPFKDFVEKSIEDPVFFATNVLGIKLHLAQKEIIRCQDRYISVRASRRFGKSFLFSAMAAWAACCNKNYRVICVSRSQRQSSEMFRTIKSMVMASKIADTITRSTLTRIEFSNNSSIESLPGSSYDSLRGIGCNMALIDECAFVNDELLAIIRPMILTSKGRLILISTPNFASGEFYRSCQPESEFTKFHFTHADVKFADGSTLIDPEDLEREMIACGGVDSPKYKKEFLAQFADSDGGFFDIESIKDALVPDMEELKFGLPGRTYVMGADLAQKQDYTVLSILDSTDKTDVKLVRIVRFNGKSTDEILQIMYKEVRAFDIKDILIDMAGIGRSLIEHLKLSYPNIRWKGLVFTNTSKTELMSDLNVALCNRILSMPDRDDLRLELVSFCYEENPNTKNLKMGGRGAHDDIVISLGLALKCAGIFKKHSGYIIGTNQGILKPPKDSEYHPNKFAKVLHY